jgi:hypothetical protein
MKFDELIADGCELMDWIQCHVNMDLGNTGF